MAAESARPATPPPRRIQRSANQGRGRAEQAAAPQAPRPCDPPPRPSAARPWPACGCRGAVAQRLAAGLRRRPAPRAQRFDALLARRPAPLRPRRLAPLVAAGAATRARLLRGLRPFGSGPLPLALLGPGLLGSGFRGPRLLGSGLHGLGAAARPWVGFGLGARCQKRRLGVPFGFSARGLSVRWLASVPWPSRRRSRRASRAPSAFGCGEPFRRALTGSGRADPDGRRGVRKGPCGAPLDAPFHARQGSSFGPGSPSTLCYHRPSLRYRIPPRKSGAG